MERRRRKTPEEIKKEESEQKEAWEQMKRNYATVGRTPQGRAMIQNILAVAGFWNDPYDPNNTHNTDYNCGKRYVGKDLFNTLYEADHTLGSIIIEENFAEKKKRRNKK